MVVNPHSAIAVDRIAENNKIGSVGRVDSVSNSFDQAIVSDFVVNNRPIGT